VLATIPAQNCKQVICPVPWIPIFLGNGHECLIVQCNFYMEGNDRLKFPLHAELDRHVAQRNLTVNPASVPQTLQLTLRNPFATPTKFALVMSSRLVWGNLELMQHELRGNIMPMIANAEPGGPHNVLERDFQLRVEDTSGLDLGVRLRDGTSITASDRPLDIESYVMRRSLGNSTSPGRSIGEFALDANAKVVAHIELPPIDVEKGAYRVLHFSQICRECIVGGYTVVVEGRD
jgi:hypothetical protein